MSVRVSPGALLLAVVGLAGCGQTPSHDLYQEYVRQQEAYAWARESASGPASRPASRPAGAELPPDAGLADYLAYAALHNPDLEAAFDAWKAALERVAQARALPDPRFSYKYYIVPQGMRDGDMRHMLELSQEFPWLGKLELRGDIAAEEAKAARQHFEAAKLKLFYDVQKAYDDDYYLSRSVQITQDNIELLKQIEAVAVARYALGAGSHPDVIRAQLEQGMLADRLRTLRKLRAPIIARLNAAMNRPATAELPWPTGVRAIEEDFSDEALLAWAAQANPEVQAMEREIAARRQGIELAKKDYYPDVMLGVEYNLMTAAGGMSGGDMMDPLAIMVGVNVPIWWEKYAAGVREARWQHLRAVNQRAALVNHLSADVQMALFAFQDAGRKINLYRDTLIPKANEALKATQTAYSGGRTGFQDYLDAQRVLLEFQLSYEQALAERASRLAELEMLVGKPLTKTSGGHAR